ncbi:MAG: TlpA disulfide reductase family protein [Desulfobacterales bacterium]
MKARDAPNQKNETFRYLRDDRKTTSYRAAILVILAVSGLLLLFSLKQNNPYLTYSPLKTGRPAPDFTFPGLNGKMVSLSDYRGHVVLVNVWATWCPPCVDEMPSMEKLYQELKAENFEILAVSIDAPGSKAVAPFMKKYNLSFPALMDPEGSIQALYQTTGVPESFIINQEGILIEKVIGARDWATPEFIDFFRDLLQKPPTQEGI